MGISPFGNALAGEPKKKTLLQSLFESPPSLDGFGGVWGEVGCWCGQELISLGRGEYAPWLWDD